MRSALLEFVEARLSDDLYKLRLDLFRLQLEPPLNTDNPAALVMLPVDLPRILLDMLCRLLPLDVTVGTESLLHMLCVLDFVVESAVAWWPLVREVGVVRVLEFVTAELRALAGVGGDELVRGRVSTLGYLGNPDTVPVPFIVVAVETCDGVATGVVAMGTVTLFVVMASFVCFP